MTDFAKTVLKAVGYLSSDGVPAEGLVLPDSVYRSPLDAARLGPLLSAAEGRFGADAIFRVGTSPVILFKSSVAPSEQEARWHRVAWNLGLAPLLWVTTPEYVRLYNAYQPPPEYGASPPLLTEFRMYDQIDTILSEVDAVCGRREITMGAFWKSTLARKINRQSRVDYVLLRELGHLLRALVQDGLRPTLAQKLVGRCIFVQYLIHRDYLSEDELLMHFGAPALHSILTDLDATYSLFRWLRETFNGDLFPIEDEASERAQLSESAIRLTSLAHFFGHFDIEDGQGRLFPFRFDAIPIELVSSIYEKFVRLSDVEGIPQPGVHYTPINLVDLVLDPVFENADADARVLDMACGSGVFLVESLRRIVWIKSRVQTLHRGLILKTLTEQIRGVDISDAALSVAAFSLYLALLELDPSPPRGIAALSELRFVPLLGSVLFSTSAFDPKLPARLFPEDPDNRVDIIVGNPPWTYEGTAKTSHREENQLDDERPSGSPKKRDSRWSGTAYARRNELKIPPRSPDWPFLWRCRDFSHPGTRIGMLMKATPFFSLASAAMAARAGVLKAFPNVLLANLSQLRACHLFQETESGIGVSGRRTRTAGPAILFLSNCVRRNPGFVSVMNFPWSPTFRRTGVFDLPGDPPRAVDLKSVWERPGSLKAAAFGTERDVWFLERLSRNPRVCGVIDWCARYGLPVGEGYQSGQAVRAGHLRGLPKVTAQDISCGRIGVDLQPVDHEWVHRSRSPALFKGPLLLLPEGSLSRAPIHGRYTAAFDERDLAFTASFVGVSFAGRRPVLGRALAAVMHSRLVAFQLAFTGGTLGIKQTRIEIPDLAYVRIPPIEELPTRSVETLAAAFGRLQEGLSSSALSSATTVIDGIVEDAAGLSDHDRTLLADSDRRTPAILFETQAARISMGHIPTELELEAYAKSVCDTFNAFASESGDPRLFADRYYVLNPSVWSLKFSLSEPNIEVHTSLIRDEPGQLDKVSVAELGGSELPYLAPARVLRIYTGRDVYFFKPAQYRYFSPSAGQSDADRIVADLMDPELATGEIVAS